MKNYRIRHESECDCYVRDINNNGGVIFGCQDVCWQGNILSINDVDVAEYVQYEGLRPLIDSINLDRIPEDIVDEMRIRWMDDDNHTDDRMSEMIEDYLNDLPEGTKYYRDNERGFGNEYTIILAGPDADPDDINPDWDEITLEEAATEIAYNGDAATQAYNGVMVL